jgi:hypothetical protein
MSTSQRGPSIDASYQASFHLATLFQSRRFLEIDQLETRIACGGHALTNMAVIGNSCFWLADFLDSSPLKPFIQMNRNMVESIYGKSSVAIAHFIPIH